MGICGHPSFNKACKYFGIKVFVAPLNPITLQVDVEAVESLITSNTICIIGSACCWPHGIVDPIRKMG